MGILYWCVIWALLSLHGDSDGRGGRHPQYGRLQDALRQYQELAGLGQWSYLPGDICLQRGDSSQHVRGLRANLALTGDLPPSEASGGFLFDGALASAVKRFQQRHGLVPDGVAGQETLRELNVPLPRRVRQIEVNLKRWERFAADTARPMVLVNIPDYTLHLLTAQGTVWSTRVVVGHTAHRTPAMEGQMLYLVLNPAWNVPASIVRREIIPVLRKDRGYLARNHMNLYQLQGKRRVRVSVHAVDWGTADPVRDRLLIVQEPGPWNALGKVKFIFPNPHDIYLHDTPSKALFQHQSRAYSHGCVRVQHPDTLAAYLLSEAGAETGDIEALWREATPNRRIALPKPVRVRIGYYTCWVDDSGALQFRRDIYGLDRLPDQGLGAQISHASPALSTHPETGASGL